MSLAGPILMSKPPTTTRRPIPDTSPEDVVKVAAKARAQRCLGLYLWLVVVSGVRRRELCSLQIRDIDLDRGLVHVAFNYGVRGGQRPVVPGRMRAEYLHSHRVLSCSYFPWTGRDGQLTGPPANTDPMRAVGSCRAPSQGLMSDPGSAQVVNHHLDLRAICSAGRLLSCFSPGPPGPPPRPRTRTGRAARR